MDDHPPIWGYNPSFDHDRTGRCLNIIYCKHRESLRANQRILRLGVPPRDPISWIQHIPPGLLRAAPETACPQVGKMLHLKSSELAIL